MSIKETIHQVTGLSPKVQDEIWLQVKANQKVLDSCSFHEFSICLDRHTKQPIGNPTPAQRFGAKWRCSRCGGDVDGHAKMWYERGQSDAREGMISRQELRPTIELLHRVDDYLAGARSRLSRLDVTDEITRLETLQPKEQP